MKIAYVLDQLLACGGCLVPFEHCRELRKRGYDAVIMANGRNQIIQDAFPDVPVEPIEDNADVVVAVWWMQVEKLNGFKGRKIQFVQGRDDLANVGDDIKKRNLETRQNKDWELLAVSKYALEWTGREGAIIPNAINERFFTKHNVERDIDILIEGNNEPHKRIDEALAIAKSVGGRIGWLGLNTKLVDGVETFTNPTQEEIPKIYQRAKVMLKLSKSEGFGLPYLEAMASGCLVFCNDAGGNDFCIDGKNCFKPKDESKIAEMIRGVLNPNQALSIYLANVIKEGEETANKYHWDDTGILLGKFHGTND